MGRLFWKFFLFLWLAQLATTIGVGIAIWLFPPQPGGEAFPPPPPNFSIQPPPPPERGPAFEENRPRPDRGPPGMPPPHPPHDRVSPPLLPLVAGSLVSLVFAIFLAWYFSRPIRSIGQAFESIAGGRLDTRIAQTMGSRKDELSDLGRGFDNMAEHLQSLVEGQQRLLHDVSHELRSPLARLQAVADLMQQQPERIPEFITRIERESTRMDKLVGELLTLARLDAGIAGSQTVSIDLNEMIATIADDAEFELQSKNGHVEIDMPEGMVVKGNSDLLHRALENIVRNAIRYSPEEGLVCISVNFSQDKHLVNIDIIDQGNGVAEADLKNIFDPFYRSSTSVLSNGYGLGLSITQRIVKAYKGSIKARNRDEGGFIVSIELPAKQDITN